MSLVVHTVPERQASSLGAVSLRDLAGHVFYNLKAISICLVLGLAAGGLAAVLSPPRSTAESLLLLRIGAAEAAQEGLNGPQNYQGGEAVARALQSEVRIVRSDPVLRAAMTTLAEDADAGISPAAMERFAKSLQVEVEEGSNVLRIAYVSRDRQQALAAVQAVIDAYAGRRAELFVNASRTRQDREIDRYGDALDQTEAAIQQVRRDHDVLDIEKDIALASDRLDALSVRAGQVRERRGAVAAELAAVSRQMGAAPDQVLDSQERTNTTPNDEARNTLLRLRQDRAHVVEQYNEDWPGLAEIDARIAAAQAQIVENAQDIRSSDRTVRNPVVDLLVSRRASLGIELASLQQQAAELAVQIGAAGARVGDLREAEMRLHDLERSRAASETIHRSLLIGRAGAALEDQAVDDRNTTVRIVQPPTVAHAARDLRPTLVLAGLALGVAMALATTAVSGVLRPVFIAPGEAKATLGLDPLMTIDATASDPQSEEGRTAVVRLAGLLLDLTVEGRPFRVFQFVGDHAPAKSRLALGVAQAMAAQGGGTVLLIDVDAADHYRRKAGQAVQRLPAGATELDVARSASVGLWAALNPLETPLGSPGATATEAKAFLDLMQGAFSHIVLVGPKAFDLPDARRLHRLADVSVLVVQAETTRAEAARRMREVVLASGGDLLGFVFTDRKHHVPEAIHRWL